MVLQRLDFQQDYPHSFLRTACESRKTLRMWGSLPSVSPLAASAPAIWIGVECSTAIQAILVQVVFQTWLPATYPGWFCELARSLG